MQIKSCLIRAFVTLLCGPALASAADVRLVVWVGDRESFGKKDLAVEQLGWDRDETVETRVLRTKEKTAERDLAGGCAHLLAEHDRVREIVIATHGSTDSKLNTTTLTGAGGFGVVGPTGGLKLLLTSLANERKLADYVHLDLSACSTLAGDVDAARGRAKGLVTFVSNLGVPRVSCWGARDPMWSATYQALKPGARYGRALREKIFSIDVISLIGGGHFVHAWMRGDHSTSMSILAAVGTALICYEFKTFVDIWRANRERIDERRGLFYLTTPVGDLCTESKPDRRYRASARLSE